MSFSDSELQQSYYRAGTAHIEPKGYDRAVTRGNVTGASELHKFGRNADVDTGSVEDIWDGGGTWAEPTTARLHTIASSDNLDIAAGGGAQTITVYGLDADYALATESVSLNGTAGTASAQTWTMIHRMVVNAAGTAGGNVGTITATADTDATVTAQIEPTNNQTLMAIYMVPAATTLELDTWYSSMNRATTTGGSDTFLKFKPDGEVWQIKDVAGLVGTGSGHMTRNYKVPLKVPAKTIVKIAADASASNTDVSGGFNGVLVQD